MLSNCILLVENNLADAQDILKTIQRHKVKNPLIHVTNSLDALEILRGQSAASVPVPNYLILLDVHLPHMNGIEFLQEFRKDSGLWRNPIVVLTKSELDRNSLIPYRRELAGYVAKENLGHDFMQVLPLLQPRLHFH